MKRLLCFAALSLLWACAGEVLPVPDNQEGNQDAKTYTVVLKASFDTATRLEVSPTDGTATWKPEDQVAVFTRNGNLVVGSITEQHDVNPTFTFTLETGDAIDMGATAYYPASIAVDGQPDQVILPAAFDNISVANQTIPMKAVVTQADIALPFKHLASMVYVPAPTSVPSYPANDRMPQDVVFSVDGDQPLTGKFTVTSDGILSPAGDNGTTIRMPWVYQEDYTFVVPVATYAQGFSVSITAGDGFTYYRKKRSASYTAERAHLLRMPAFDPQCKLFYLTSSETDWSDAVTSARMIQTSENAFLGALYSHRGPKGDWDLGLRILQGYNLGTHWNNVIGGIENSDIAIYGEHVGNFNGNPPGVYKVSITLYDNNWRYTSERVGDEYHHEHLYLVGDFDNWDQGGIELQELVGHNWYAQVSVSATAKIKPDTDYGWKIFNGSWAVQWNNGTINADKLSSYVNFDNVHDPNGTLNLPAGTYDVFFNDTTGWIQFEKK